MASPLPPVMETNLSNLPDGNPTLHAYNACLDLQQKVTAADDLMHARILGYLILHAPSEIARAEVARAIHSCSQDEKKLLILGECFRLWYITPFKRFKGRTPAESDHPSRPSYDRLKEDLKAPIKEEPKDHRQAKAQALIRDGYKCVVTGQYDKSIKGSNITVPKRMYFIYTECAHILPQSTYFNVSNPGDKKVYAASVLAVLQRFGYDVDKVNGPKVHSLYNVMTMEKNVHEWFDHLELWFESMGVENHYRIQTCDEPHPSLPPEVTFTSSDPENLSLPSPKLLTLHAVCAKVAHLSGAREYIDKFDRDADDLDVLAPDGSSHDILGHVLGMLVPIDTAV